MTDMLVKLYGLPDVKPLMEKLKSKGVEIRRPIAPEKHIVVNWVHKVFGIRWADECEVAFSNKPVSCFIATKDRKVIGFACYDVTAKNFAGPMGVDKNFRKKKVGKALVLMQLHAMREEGYIYAINGDVDPNVMKFFQKSVKATLIKDSEEGIYKDMLTRES